MRSCACLVISLFLASGCSEGPTSAAGDAGVNSCTPDASYLACGCGCCTGAATQERCVDTDGGQTLQQIIDADTAAAAGPSCAMAGCSTPTLYRCCK